MKIKILLISLAVMLLISLSSNATHINGGYISYKVDPQNPLKYNFTLTVFKNDESPADEPTVQIRMGDQRHVTVYQSKQICYLNLNSIVIYEWEHTYTAVGNYVVSWSGLSRNRVVNTTPPSDELSQFISTQVHVGFSSVNNNSVKTIVPAPFEAFVGEPFKMNMIAYDADNDRLTYELVQPQYLDQNDIPQNLPGYQFPSGLYINKFGEVYWQNPTTKGEYAISVKITEYKEQQPVGYTIVDMSLKVKDREHQPVVQLLNNDRLTINYDGSVYAKPEQTLKLEYFVKNAPDRTNTLTARQYSDLDTLGLLTPALAARDSADGLAVTLILNPEISVARNQPYSIGLRGGALRADHTATGGTKEYMYGWEFVNVYVGAQQPTSSGDLAYEISLYVYPNSVSDKVIIEGAELKQATLYLWNIMGQQVAVKSLGPGKNMYTRPSSLAPGTYLYRIVSGNKMISAGKLIFN